MSKFTPSPQEVALVNQIFTQADAQKIGVVTGEAAVKIFSGTQLPPSTLAEVWTLADEDNKGVLTRKDVAVAVRLLGHAQRGERITEALIQKQGPPPTIEGLNAPLTQQWTGTPAAKSPPPGPAAGLPPLTPQDKTKFAKLFQGCGPSNGILQGDKAREVFVKSKLPVDKLSAIWALADTKSRGALDLADFTIAMYLIQASMSGSLHAIPAALPPYLYEQAKPGPDAIVSHATGSSGFSSPTAFGGGFPGRPVSTIQPQYTGSAILQPQITGQRPVPTLPSRIPAFPLAPQATGQQPQWDVTPQEKANFDNFFDTLDTQKKNYIEGDVAVPFMLQSKLSDDILAQVWDLADMNNDGRLTRDGFAVAMHLIQSKLAGKDIPTTLPPSLIPPSLRSKVSAQPPQPAVPEAIRDLLWDDTPVSVPTPQPTVSTFTPPRASTTSPKPAPPPSNFFGAADPFASASTSSPFNIPPSAPAPAPVEHQDLLGDDDEPTAASPPLQDKSAEIGNTQNQLHSTNRAVETSRREREDLERKVAEQSAQLTALQTQLTSAKVSYETETRLLVTLRERLSTQTTDILKSRQELIHAESDLSAVRVEKSEVEGSVLRDKEEVRELNRKMAEVGTEVESLKAQMEKIKKEAKQQKGLLAIAKKQLATREAERAKVLKELEEAQAEADATSKELEEAEAALAKEPEPIPSPQRVASPSNDSITAFAATQPLPASPEPTIATPTSGVSGKSTNPFERLTMSPGTPRSQSPFLPFAGATVLPTPPFELVIPLVAPAAEPPASDPFGFEDAFGGEPASSEVQQSSVDTMETENDSPFDVSETPNAEPDLLSPTETDHFMTPPSTATLQPTSAIDSGPESAISPAVESQIPGHFAPSAEPRQEDKHEDTDLNTQLKEIEIDDSDTSDSDDDEPLDHLKAKLNHGTVASTSSTPAPGSAFDDSFGIASSESPVVVSHPTIPEASSAAAFSTPGETPKAVVGSTSPFAIPASQEPVTSTSSESSGAAGVSDFDEAIGKIPGGSATSTSQISHVSEFTFDDAFEDDFDFDAAKAAVASEPVAIAAPSAPVQVPAPAPVQTSAPAFPPPPAHTPRSEGFDAVFLPSASSSAPTPSPFSTATPTAAPSAAQSLSFEDTFITPSNGNAAPVVQQSSSGVSLGISFDDAFGGQANDALALDNSFANSVQQPTSSNIPHPTSQSSTPFPTSTPSSPVREASASISSRRSMSPPPRAISPAPRGSKSRPSTATSEKDKEKPTRHSKLSIRLPFGRKKPKHDPMPSSLSHSLLAEEPSAVNGTPAAEDDIDAVKTLCSMGFSRTQAVTALEQYDYDVQRALNSLLGTR